MNMRRWPAAVLALAMTLALLPAGAFAAGGTLLALGDSITAGYGLAETEEASRADSFVARAAKEMGLRCDNRAVSGATSADLRALVESGAMDEAVEDAAAVSVTIGGNDLFHCLLARTAAVLGRGESETMAALTAGESGALSAAFGVLGLVVSREENPDRAALEAAVAACRENVTAAVEYIRGKNPDAPVVLFTQYHPYYWMEQGAFLLSARQAGQVIDRLNAALATVEGVLLADGRGAFLRPERLCNASLSPLNLDFHPNDRGHAVLAETLVKTLRPFSDVGLADWRAEAVRTVAQAGWMRGVTEERFDPMGTVTRAQAAVILCRMADGEVPEEPAPFADVPAWCAGEVAWAAEAGVLTGYGDGTFRPGGAVTRAQLAAMLWRMTGEPESETALDGFTDGDAVPGYAVRAMAWAVETGLYRGDGGALAPNRALRRGELAAVLARFDGMEIRP